jgi:hypothetical protein
MQRIPEGSITKQKASGAVVPAAQPMQPTQPHKIVVFLK